MITDLNRSASLNRSSIDSSQSNASWTEPASSTVIFMFNIELPYANRWCSCPGDSALDYSTRYPYSDMEAQVLAASEDVMSEWLIASSVTGGQGPCMNMLGMPACFWVRFCPSHHDQHSWLLHLAELLLSVQSNIEDTSRWPVDRFVL